MTVPFASTSSPVGGCLETHWSIPAPSESLYSNSNCAYFTIAAAGISPESFPVGAAVWFPLLGAVGITSQLANTSASITITKVVFIEMRKIGAHKYHCQLLRKKPRQKNKNTKTFI